MCVCSLVNVRMHLHIFLKQKRHGQANGQNSVPFLGSHIRIHFAPYKGFVDDATRRARGSADSLRLMTNAKCYSITAQQIPTEKFASMHPI